MRRVTRIVGGAVAALLLGLLLSGYLPKPLPVEVARVTRGPLQLEVEEDGKVRVRDRYTVSAPVAGTVARCELHPGDPVQQGAVLARLLPLGSQLLDPRARSAAQARLDAAGDSRRQAVAAEERAKEALSLARSEEVRTAQLARSGATTDQQLEQAGSAVRQRESELASARFAARVAVHAVEEARAALGTLGPPGPGSGEQLSISAPVDGRVLRVVQESEAAVAAGAPLLELGDPRSLEVVVDLLTVDAVRVQPGMRASLLQWGGDHPLQARVRRVEPSAVTKVSALGVEEQRVNVLLDLLGPPEGFAALGDGYSVEARIVVWEQEGVLQAPASALFRQGQGWAAYVLAGGKARLRSVQLGQRVPLQVQVLSGLAEGEQVILHPGDRVREGASVSAR